MSDLIDSLKNLIIQAGDIAIDRKQQGLIIEKKQDHSVVTNADKEIDQLICQALRFFTPNVPIVSEEGVNTIPLQDSFWLVDPIDGTKSYIKNKDTYTLNIALIENYTPTIGLIYQPDTKKLYYTSAEGDLKIEQNNIPLALSPITYDHPYIATIGHHGPKSTITQLIKNLNIDEIRTVSSSLKLCLIAEGSADFYPSLSKKMLWDIAAGHALIKASKGTMTMVNGQDLPYYQDNFESPYFYAYSKRLLNSGMVK